MDRSEEEMQGGDEMVARENPKGHMDVVQEHMGMGGDLW